MVLLVSLVLVAIVAAAVALVLRHNRAGNGHATGAVHASTSRSPSASAAASSPTSAAASAASAASSPAAPATAAAAPSTSASASVTASAVPTGQPTATPVATPSQSAPAARVPLRVLNDSRISGLAARAASAFRSAGWKIVETGNYAGPVVPATTVYYPPADLASARELAREFPRIKRLVADRTLSASGPMLVVVARDWQDGN